MNAVLAIAYRDVVKFLRDRPRIVATFVFPLVFIGILGGSLQAGFGQSLPYDLLTFTFVGVLGQTLFQSTALGIISLLEDRDSDFTQEIFVSPVSRYAIVLGKIIGEGAVALVQAVGILAFGAVLGVPLGGFTVLELVPVMLVACLAGGSFGILVLSRLQTRRAADQIFPFVMLPQFFLAGIFVPLAALPFYLDILSRLSPLRYVVDLLRGTYYSGRPAYDDVTLTSPLTNLVVLAVLFVIFMAAGTTKFVRSERNR